jgi:hypothetical protein
LTLIEDYGLDSPPRKLLLLSLSIADRRNNKAMDKLRIQKVIRFYEYLCVKKEIDFSNYKLGGVSYELDENRENLLEYELIEQTDRFYTLTPEGNTAVDELCEIVTPADYNCLVFAKQQLNDMTDDEMLFFMYMTIPETQKVSTEFGRLERKKGQLIECLFAKRKIDVAIAAKWLKISERDFVKLHTKKGIPANLINSLIEGYQKSAEDDLEIARSFENSENSADGYCDA